MFPVVFPVLAALHGIVLAAWPSLPVVALGVWWNSNTISHNFIHRPFFPRRWQNRIFSAYLSVLLGIPQSLWRERHLAHHAGTQWRLRVSPQIAIETTLVLSLWTAFAIAAPRFFFAIYIPGYLIGLALCALQGHYEHVTGVVSHYGVLYNFFCFNDGYHAEHHAYPGVAWRDLPSRRASGASSSRWPAPLRWLDFCSLETLEKLVLRSPRLQRYVLARHRRALSTVLSSLHPTNITIVGGGLFPRSALILRSLFPASHISVIDESRDHLEIARAHLPCGVDLTLRHFDSSEQSGCDLLVIPLSFHGDREQIYRHPPARAVLVHDWIWSRRGSSRIVSVFLLKRANLITR